jgi:hypothetical protein
VASQPFSGVRSQYRKIQENKVPDIKSTEMASQVFAADLAALRDDITKLTASISELMPERASATTSTVYPFLSVLAAFSAGLLIGVMSHIRK